MEEEGPVGQRHHQGLREDGDSEFYASDDSSEMPFSTGSIVSMEVNKYLRHSGVHSGGVGERDGER